MLVVRLTDKEKDFLEQIGGDERGGVTKAVSFCIAAGMREKGIR